MNKFHFNPLFLALAIVITLSIGYKYKTMQKGYYEAENANNKEVCTSFDTILYPNWKQANQQERFFSDRWEEVARIPDFDTCIFPYWIKADSLCFETYPGDLRYTDLWCEIASNRPIDLGAQIIITNSHHSHNCNYNDK